jgi:hypothetical protein
MNAGDAPRTVDERKDGGGEDAERALESEIGRLRDDLDAMIGELDRRRHEALDVRLQLRRHSGVVAAVGGVAVVLVLAGFAAWTASRRRQDRLLVRLQNLARAVVIMSRNPARLERALEGRAQPGAAVASAIATVAGAAGRRAILGPR